MTDDIFSKLAAPFPPESVHWRVGPMTKDKTKGIALAYIDARDVMDRLDTVCGPGDWQSCYTNAGNGATCCEIGILVKGVWLWKSDGAGQSDQEGDKGQFSGAFKRAAVHWGIGRYLYDVPNLWVALDGKNIDPREKPKLHDALKKVSQAIEWSDPTDRNTYRILVDALKEFDAGNLEAFIEEHIGMIANLPVAMRTHLNKEIDRIKELEAA